MSKPTRQADSRDDRDVILDHRRQWRDCWYVYPVISRRSKGLSVGVNLNLDKACNFACLYCQIDRTTPRQPLPLEPDRLEAELELALNEAVGGRLWDEPRFAGVSRRMRRINDIAFSGDGEPTCAAGFGDAVEVAATIKRRLGLDDVKLVVITNASRMLGPQMQQALPILDANNGEIWAKLDAGTEEYFQRVNRPQEQITLQQVVDGIIAVAREREIVIQTLMLKIDGAGLPPRQLHAYCERIREIVDAGGRIRLIQLHTIARAPSKSCASALSNGELDDIAGLLAGELPTVPVEKFYGHGG